MNVALGAAVFASEAHLVYDFIRGAARPDTVRRDGGPQMPLAIILRGPPVQQFRKTLLARVDVPVKLWRGVVEPPLAKPLQGIRVENLVRVQASHGGRMTRPPNSEWADADFHPGLFNFYA